MEMEKYDEAYDVLSQAAKLAPDDGFLLYIYSQSCKYTHRLAKASVAIEEAVTLEPALLKNRNTKKELNSIRKTIQNVIKLSGKDFTFEQLIEQEELEITGLRLVKEHKLEEAEALFRQVIAMGDIMIAPHNNLAHCLLRRGKFKEAEQELLIVLKMDRRNPVARNNLPVVREAIKTGKIPEFSGVYNPHIGQITDIQPTHSNLPTGSDLVPD
ncbi:hypothetical protein KDH_49280 [Dictyobacter sp. S3.2.2.5]|uniref:Tetratricopeptide repeat protein n=2 Tax=Dictyobacter halimunensis TaxID=3026934 RepID=A0ABQ6FV15_9CHLR|nr:hypothetical protein KDH_49280 [Dictyobacter sp. S3.2.2.5]